MLFELLAIVCAGLFAGAALYITFVEQPARLECGTALAATEFGPSYRRATVMQASLAAVGLAAATLAWIQGRGFLVLLGGLMLGIVIPFTLLVILPTNRRLLDPGLDRASAETQRLLERWGRLHALRSGTSAAGFLVLVSHLAWARPCPRCSASRPAAAGATRQPQRPAVERMPRTTVPSLMIAADFRAEPSRRRSRLITETRVAETDQRALLGFRLYWLVVRPFSKLTRRRWLRALHTSGKGSP